MIFHSVVSRCRFRRLWLLLTFCHGWVSGKPHTCTFPKNSFSSSCQLGPRRKVTTSKRCWQSQSTDEIPLPTIERVVFRIMASSSDWVSRSCSCRACAMAYGYASPSLRHTRTLQYRNHVPSSASNLIGALQSDIPA
jgi:hypothetical protein